MNNKELKVYLVDGTALIYRSYYAFIGNPLRNSQGHNTSAVFGVANTFFKFFNQHSPRKIIVSFDLKEPTFRHEITDTYKANRPPAPDELIEQIQPVKEFFNRLSIPEISLEGYEADDVLATLAKKLQGEYKVFIVTSDKDFCQIVNDRVTLYDPFSDRYLTPQSIEKKYGIKPEQFRDYLAIVGDSADNIPGIKGIGPKGASSLLKDYHSLAGIYSNIDNVKSKSLQNKLQDGEKEVQISRELVTLVDDAPLGQRYDIEKSLSGLDLDKNSFKNLLPYLKEYELNSLYKKIETMGKDENQTAGNTIANDKKQTQNKSSVEEQQFFIDDTPDKENRQYNSTAVQSSLDFYTDPFEFETIVIDSEESVAKLLKELSNSEITAVEIFDSPVDKDKTTKAALAVNSESVFYLDLKPDIIDLLESVKLADRQHLGKLKKIVGHNLKRCHHQLIKRLPTATKNKLSAADLLTAILSYHSLIETSLADKLISGNVTRFDCMIASYLIDANNPQHNLPAVVNRELNHHLMTKREFEKEMKSKEFTPAELSLFIGHFLCKNAFCIYKLHDKLSKKLEPYKNLFYDLEMPLAESLAKMEAAGVYVDTGKLKEINSLISAEISKLSDKIQSLAGKEFNINSPQQLSKILFEEMQLPVIKKTKTGYSTDNTVLEKLTEKHEIAAHLIDYRQLTKLKSTYIESLPTLINDRTGRIHSTFNQAITTTGRLSSSNPNLQNIPIRSEAGKHIRKAFMPEPDKNDELAKKYGKVLILSADYSQIELRLLASMSKDRNLVSAFNNKQDIHAQTAGLILGKPITQVDQDERRMAKTINFGLIYGMGPVKLSKEINVSREEAKRFIEEYFKKFPKIKDFINATVLSAKRKGYAETIMGRRLYLPNITSSSQRYSSEAERVAFNMPIQGSAADVIKLAMIRIDEKIELLHSRYNDFKDGGSFAVRMIIQVHDELVFEVRESFVSQAKEIIVSEMKRALPEKYRIIVPLAVDVGWGSNWFESHG